MNKQRKIKEQIEKLGQRLVAAGHYIERNVNIRGSDWLHLANWNGKSGHPLWMRNRMIPSTQRTITEKERALQKIGTKAKEKGLKERKRQPGHD
jgi:hypothetical protein